MNPLKIVNATPMALLVVAALLSSSTRLRAQAEVSTFVYVTNYGANSVSGYAVDDSTGSLTPVQGSPFATNIQPAGVAVDRSNRFLYVANNFFGNAGNLSAYAIDGTTGALTPLQGSPFKTTNQLSLGLATEPSGRFLYVTNNYTGSTEVFAIDATTGTLAATAGSPFSATSGSYSFPSVDPSGRFLFNSASTSPPEAQGLVFVSSIDPDSGALTPVPGSPFLAGRFTLAVGSDTSSRFVYAGNKWSQDISAFTLDATTGGLTPVSGSPFPAIGSPTSISAHPSGRFLYVSNVGFRSNIAVFTIDGATGELTLVPGSPAPVPGFSWQGTLDPSGRFYFAVNSMYPNVEHSISAFTVDAATGALSEAPGSPFNTGTDPSSLAVAQVARP